MEEQKVERKFIRLKNLNMKILVENGIPVWIVTAVWLSINSKSKNKVWRDFNPYIIKGIIDEYILPSYDELKLRFDHQRHNESVANIVMKLYTDANKGVPIMYPLNKNPAQLVDKNRKTGEMINVQEYHLRKKASVT